MKTLRKHFRPIHLVIALPAIGSIVYSIITQI